MYILYIYSYLFFQLENLGKTTELIFYVGYICMVQKLERITFIYSFSISCSIFWTLKISGWFLIPFRGCVTMKWFEVFFLHKWGKYLPISFWTSIRKNMVAFSRMWLKLIIEDCSEELKNAYKKYWSIIYDNKIYQT